MEVPLAVEPRAAALPSRSVPELTVVAPEYVLVPDNNVVPVVVVSPPVLMMFPLMVNVPPDTGASVAVPSRYTSFEKVAEAVAPLVPMVLVAAVVLGAT
jgi:hypothetical protein